MDYLVLALATWRMASILAYEEGPLAIFERLRQYAERRAPWLAKGINCLWCNSVWFGVSWSALYVIDIKSIYLALPFAFSAAAIITDEIINRIKFNGAS